MSWMTDEIIGKAKKVLTADPINKRQAIAGQLGITEYKAREILKELDHEPQPLVGPTMAVFDLETTKLEGHFGRLLCGSVLSCPSGSMESFRWDDYSRTIADDRALAVAIRGAIESHDISCGFFTKGFDIGFLNARLVWHGERKMEPMPHFDVMWGYKGWRGLKIGSSSMKNVSEYLGLDEQKMGVPKEVWVRAGTGDTEALDTIVERCESDVRVTLEIANHSLKNKLIKNPFAVYP